ncbi:MAG: TolC family protein [Verrucomicrobia bacterium]|nr:TolC family protein [Verrucomicrobiota bacterium]
MKSPWLFPFTCLLIATFVLAREPLKPFLQTGLKILTLEEAVQVALCQNPLILNAKQEIERTRGQVIEVRAQALPRVTLNAIYQQQDPNLIRGQSTQFGGQRAATAPTPTPPPPPTPTPTPGTTPVPSATPSPTPMVSIQDKTWQVTVQVNQLLYSGGRVQSALRIARLSQDETFFRLCDAIDTVIATVRTQFYQVLVNRALIGVQEESVALLSSQLADQETRYRAGTVPRFNVLQAQVALANAQPNLIAARNNYHLAQLQLAKTLGYETRNLPARQEPFNLMGELSIPPVTMDLACALQTARERNPSLRAQRQNILIEVEDVLLQKAGYKPTLSANAGYIVENNRLSRNLGDVVNGWFFSLQGNWNIFDGGETYGKVKQARARLEQAKINYEDTVQQVDVQVQQAWANLLQARETITSGQATVTQAKEAVRLARERLNAGVGTQLDVLNATVQLTQAQTTELQARNSYNAALAEFDRVTSLCARCEESCKEPVALKHLNR